MTPIMSTRRTWLIGVLVLVCAAIAAGVWIERRAPGGSDQPAVAGAQSDAQAIAAQRVTTVENSVRALEDAERDAPRDRWDPAYVVGKLGTNPEVLLAWVRANTAWIPYRGALRGAAGVLMDRQGNSLDRAILLATLLETAGHRVRLANVTLSEGDALRNVASGPPPANDVPLDRRVSPEALRTAAEHYHLDAAVVASSLERNHQAISRLASELDARVADQTSRLLRAGVRRPGQQEWQRRFEAAVDARRDHWWVQLEAGGAWKDLDVDDPLAAMQDPGVPRRTVALGELPKLGLQHQITVRVVAERRSRGTATSRTELEHALVPSELLGQPIVLQFMAESTMREERVPAVDADFTALANDERVWLASLSVGSEVVATGAIQNAVQGGGDAGALGGAILGMARKDDQALTAVWIEYEFKVPGEAPRVIRRTVFDLIGPSARASNSGRFTLDSEKRMERALALTMRTELLPISCRLSKRFVGHLASTYAIQNRQLLTAAARAFGGPPPAALIEAADNAPPAVTPLYALALARLDWSGDAARVYIDRPGLLTRHSSFARVGGELVIRSATDIVANDIGVSLGVRDAFRLRLAHGVLDTNAEALLHGFRTGGDNVGEAFTAAHRWMALRPDQSALVDDLQLDPDVRQRIREDLAAGFAVVAPQSPVPTAPQPFVGWWRIDPVSGQSLGVGATGWGQAAENAAINRRNAASASVLKRMGLRFAKMFVVAWGTCYVIHSAQEIERSHGFILGVQTVIARDSGQCFGEGVFWGSLVTLPIVAISARVSLMTEVEGEVAAAAGEPGMEAAAESGTSPRAGSVPPPAPNSPRAGSVPPPAPRAPGGSNPPPPAPPPPPRGLGEIGAELEAANGEVGTQGERLNAAQDQYYRAKAEARNNGQPPPPYPEELGDAVVDKSNALGKQEALRNEYVQAGGQLGPNSQPMGPRPAGGGWMEGGPHAGELGSPAGPPPNPGSPGGAGGVDPLANTVPAGGPQHAPVRGGPPNLPTDQTVLVGHGGLFGIK